MSLETACICIPCEYATTSRANLNKHKQTEKHRKNSEEKQLDADDYDFDHPEVKRILEKERLRIEVIYAERELR
jgi:hypothetical protein